MNNKYIAIIDDEEDILELVSLHLEKEGYKVGKFHNGHLFLESLKKDIPELIILDIMLPDVNGYDICKFIKNNSKYNSIKIIMLSAKGEVMDKILGLELGAEDYMAKPFSPKELVARVRAVLRRGETNKNGNEIIKAGDIIINRKKIKVTIKDKIINLTSTEFKILMLLCENKGYVFTRDRLLDYLWDEDKFVLDRTIDVHIRNLRKKLGKSGEIIKSIRGMGYKAEE
jgi:two-component system phosphate regulon response regulator PhoB/two-component system alkaline phosphatase synthesis response regulator PhoP